MSLSEIATPYPFIKPVSGGDGTHLNENGPTFDRLFFSLTDKHGYNIRLGLGLGLEQDTNTARGRLIRKREEEKGSGYPFTQSPATQESS
ncbi:MAG TPA: hypothetical protein VLA39_09540 [Marinobacterium sp.]|nr:hypothetical protein [Marinobacterium sp.]